MNRIDSRRALALLLVLCILVVGSLASAQSIAHEAHHAHHQKATHATMLCSWMCAAGQVISGPATPYLTDLHIIASNEPLLRRFDPQISFRHTTSRGPPLFSPK